MKILKKLNLNIITIILALLVTFSAVAIIIKSFIVHNKFNATDSSLAENFYCDCTKHNMLTRHYCVNKNKTLDNFENALRSAANPIYIEDYEGLKLFETAVNEKGYEFENTMVYLYNNIDCQGNTVGIGEYYETTLTSTRKEYIFKGTFNGVGHTISNVQYNGSFSKTQTNTDGDPWNKTYSLFTKINSNTTIQNLRVSNVGRTNDDGISGDSSDVKFVGGLVGWSDGGTISNCIVDNFTVRTKDETDNINVGGLFATGHATVENCYISQVTIQECLNSAGIGPCSPGQVNTNTGYRNPYGTRPSTIKNCVVKTITTNASNKYDYSVATYKEYNRVSYSSKDVSYNHTIENCYNSKTGDNFEKLGTDLSVGGETGSAWYYGGSTYNSGWPYLRSFISNWYDITFTIKDSSTKQTISNAGSIQGIVTPSCYTDYTTTNSTFSMYNQFVNAPDLSSIGYKFVEWKQYYQGTYYVYYEKIKFDITFVGCEYTDKTTSSTYNIYWGTVVDIIQTKHQIKYSFMDSSGTPKEVIYNISDYKYYITGHNLSTTTLNSDTANINNISPTTELKTYGSIWQ